MYQAVCCSTLFLWHLTSDKVDPKGFTFTEEDNTNAKGDDGGKINAKILTIQLQKHNDVITLAISPSGSNRKYKKNNRMAEHADHTEIQAGEEVIDS